MNHCHSAPLYGCGAAHRSHRRVKRDRFGLPHKACCTCWCINITRRYAIRNQTSQCTNTLFSATPLCEVGKSVPYNCGNVCLVAIYAFSKTQVFSMVCAWAMWHPVWSWRTWEQLGYVRPTSSTHRVPVHGCFVFCMANWQSTPNIASVAPTRSGTYVLKFCFARASIWTQRLLIYFKLRLTDSPRSHFLSIFVVLKVVAFRWNKLR